MAIRPVCDFCKKELRDFGAILLSPPKRKMDVKKYHVCLSCYKKIIALKVGQKLPDARRD